MSDSLEDSVTKRRHPFRFSIGTTLLWLGLFGLVVYAIVISRRLSTIEQAIEGMRNDARQHEIGPQGPISLTDVATQFEKATTRGSITTAVKDVRYSPAQDSYKVDFSWTIAGKVGKWNADVELEADGYGVYRGAILNRNFTEPIGYGYSFPVLVETPSPLAAARSKD